MSKTEIYEVNYPTPSQVTDEDYSNIGTSELQLGFLKRTFKGGDDLVIRTAKLGGGTKLIENTNYTLVVDVAKTIAATAAGQSYTVYSGIFITDLTYQSGVLYFTYKTPGSYTSADWANTLQESSSGYFRNMLLNGDFRIAQEQSNTSVSGEYFVDQFRLIHNNTVTASQDGNFHFTDSEYSGKLIFTGTAIGEYGGIDTPVPAYRSSVYFGKSAQIRFDIEQTAISAGAQSVEVIVQCPNAKDSGAGYETLITSDPISLDGTAQSLSVTLDLSGSTSSAYTVKNGALIFAKITQAGATGTSTVYIGDVQINEGDVSLPFQPRNDLNELLTFYRQFDGVENTAEVITIGSMQSTTGFQGALVFDPPMFKAPTLTISDVAHFLNVANGAGLAISTLTMDLTTKKSTRISATSAATTGGFATLLRLQNAAGRFKIDARIV